jgi:hypothetical protein
MAGPPRETVVDLDLEALDDAVGLVGHADHGDQFAQHGVGHAGPARGCRVGGNAITAPVGRTDGEINHLFGQRVERAGRHDLLHALPRALERGRMIGESLPEIIDPIDAAGRHDVVIDRAHLGIGLRVLDQRYGCHVPRSLWFPRRLARDAC